jgi:hypothetical protein
MVIDLFGENSTTDHLLNLLRKALGTSESVEIKLLAAFGTCDG